MEQATNAPSPLYRYAVNSADTPDPPGLVSRNPGSIFSIHGSVDLHHRLPLPNKHGLRFIGVVTKERK